LYRDIEVSVHPKPKTRTPNARRHRSSKRRPYHATSRCRYRLQPQTPKPETRNPKTRNPETRNPKPETRNPKLKIWNSTPFVCSLRIGTWGWGDLARAQGCMQTRHPNPENRTPNPEPQTPNLKPPTLTLKPRTGSHSATSSSNLNPDPSTSHLKPQTPTSKPQTPNPKSQTPNPTSQTPNLNLIKKIPGAARLPAVHAAPRRGGEIVLCCQPTGPNPLYHRDD